MHADPGAKLRSHDQDIRAFEEFRPWALGLRRGVFGARSGQRTQDIPRTYFPRQLAQPSPQHHVYVRAIEVSVQSDPSHRGRSEDYKTILENDQPAIAQNQTLLACERPDQRHRLAFAFSLL